ncbi:MAG: hypothetical protein KDA24_24225 [Deltaproteobacteria bacterium]|nr:hypothetical protein [Deltaproteobacteria bacterium]
MTRHACLALLPALLAVGCPGTGPDGNQNLALAAGVEINEVAIYQGVKRSLMVDGETVDSEVPLIEGRDALVRVFVSSDSDYDGEAVTGRLTLGDEVIEVEVDRVREESRNHNLETTVNFEVPGDLIGDRIDWSVELMQDGGAGDNPEARYPTEGTDTVLVEGRPNRLRLVIAPFRYDFDGSGRLPDVSDEQVERIRARFLALYPVSDVQIRVRDPEPWAGEISPNGDGWYGPGFQLLGFRQADGESDDAYYYGMFNPTETLAQFCGFGGCLLGVTLLNDSPPDTGSVNLRIGLGLGFTEQSAGTAVHEIGHAHGRQHSPCGPAGNPPADPHPGYPNSDGTLEAWGYDIVDGTLHEPGEATDFMGYCDDQFVSAFTYTALHRRGTNVNAGLSVEGELMYDLFAYDGEALTYVQPLSRTAPASGHAVDVVALTDEHPSPRQGLFVRWDHIPGGVLLVPRDGLQPRSIEAVLDGRFVSAEAR